MSAFAEQIRRGLRVWKSVYRALRGPGAEKSPDAQAGRYARDWNAYSRTWDDQHGKQYTHLGEEWNDDQTPGRKRDAYYFTAYAERWVRPDMTVLEVGPGGGKWTVRLAPRVKRLFVLDVAEEMLKRTRTRCEALGITNVEYILGNGKDFRPVADESIHFFFSYDVFVHIALEDTWPYAQEIARVLAPGARGACHYAINSIPDAWDEIEQENSWYRGGKDTCGQFYYFSPETLRRMYERCGLRVLEQHVEERYCTCVFEKLFDSIAPRFEALLKELINQDADDDQVRARIVASLQALPGDLAARLAPVLLRAEQEKDFYKRREYAAEIRRIWRGI